MTSNCKLLMKCPSQWSYFLVVRIEYLILYHREVLYALQFILGSFSIVLSLLDLYFYFSENYVKTARKYLYSGLTKSPVLRMEISTCCSNIEQLLESFQEVLKQIRDNYERKQVCYICTRKYTRNKSESFVTKA